MPAAAQDQHPSQHRGATRLWVLLYGLIAAPAAWMTAQVVAAWVAQRACFPGYAPRAAPAFGGVQAIGMAALILALAVSVSGLLAALAAWRRTRQEHEGGGGPALDVGEGRSRFMALTGVMTSTGFSLAGLFSLPAVLLTPVC